MASGSNGRNPPRILKLTLTVLYTLLLSTAIIIWIVNTIIVKEYNWECINCRADEDPSYAPQFLFYSVWSLWLTFGVFILWAYFTPSENKASSRGYIVSKIIFQVALPHVTTVMLTYLYYGATNPAEEFVNRDLCYYLGRAFLHKDVTDNETAVNAYLVFGVLTDFTIHYFSAPLLLYLYVTGQIPYDVWFPWSTVFVIMLSAIIAPVQILADVPIYCGSIWFAIGGSILINFAFHIGFCVLSRGKLGMHQWGCVLIEDDANDGDDEHPVPADGKEDDANDGDDDEQPVPADGDAVSIKCIEDIDVNPSRSGWESEEELSA